MARWVKKRCRSITAVKTQSKMPCTYHKIPFPKCFFSDFTMFFHGFDKFWCVAMRRLLLRMPAATRGVASEAPTRVDLRRHFVVCAVPMVGFGLMDTWQTDLLGPSAALKPSRI